ncbi:hypothetical protein [Ethanoligenens sp.]|uniref:hypothetical protein n=1 Tax=Ethanoligenens sp. TaxID=2099655 RepID=UPI0039ECB2C3
MKKRMFDPALFWEGIRQLKLSGVALLVVSLILNALPPLFGWMSILNQQRMTRLYPNAYSAQDISFHVSAIRLAPTFIPLMYLIPIILCMVLFGSFHTRKGSDFYHSLSNTRGSIFLSFGAAALAWYAVIAALSVLLPTLLYSILGAAVIPSYIVQVFFTYLAGGILVAAVMLLAMSLTGTPVANLIVAAMILFLPRVINTFFTMAISSSLTIIRPQWIGVLGNMAYNIPAKFPLYFLLHSNGNSLIQNSDDLFLMNSAIPYTLVLAAIYFVLGWLAFRARRSESAGRSAPSRLLQHIYRCAFTLPVAMLIPFDAIYHPGTDQIGNDIIISIVALLVYFLFELISTKKFKNLLTAAPVLLVLVALDVLLWLGANGIRNQVLNVHLTANDIQSVTIDWTESNYNSSRIQYNDLLTKGIRYTEADVRQRVATDLDSAIKIVKHNLRAGSSNMQYLQLNYSAVIRTKDGRTLTRYLGNNSNLDSTSKVPSTMELDAAMQKNPAYAAASTILPTDAEIENVSLSEMYNGSNTAQAKNIWTMYRTEYEKLSNAQRTSLLFRYTSANDTESIGTINIGGSHGLQYYYGLYGITPLTPKTATACIDLSNTTSNLQRAQAAMTQYNGKTTHLQASVFNTNSDSVKAMSVSSTDAITILPILQNNLGKPVDVAEPFVKLQVFLTNPTITVYLPLTAEDLNTMRQSGFLN